MGNFHDSEDDISRSDITGPDRHGSQRRWLHTNAEIRPDSARREEKYLNETEMKYLLEGETGTTTESKIDERLRNKAPGLRIRFQRLINDIALMNYGGYVDEEGDTWYRLLHDHEAPPDQTFIHNISNIDGTIVGHDAGADVMFGYDLGLALRLISGAAHDTERAADFLWGIVLANSATTSGQTSDEKQNLKKVRNKIDNRREEHYKFAISYQTEEEEKRNNRDKRIIKQVLSDYDIEFTETLYMDILNSARFVESHSGGIGYVDNSEIDESLVRSIVDNSLTQEYFSQAMKICSGLREEWENVEIASAPGVKAKEVLESVWEHNKPSSDNIAQQMSPTNSSKYSKQVTQTLNKLSKEGKNPHSDVITTYTHASIVEWSQSEAKSGAWSLTAYGKLLCYFVFEKELGDKWVHDIMLMKKSEGSNILLTSDIHFLMRGGKEILESK